MRGPLRLCPCASPALTAWSALAPALLLALSAGQACAKPKGVNLEQVVSASEVIAVARFCGDAPLDRKARRVELELTRVLKGGLRPGRYTATFADLPRVGPDCPEFVAFFREGLCWRFAALPIAPGNALADSALRVEGFYDWNAYLVSPGLATLGQIEGLLRGLPLRYRFRGRLHFPRRGRPGWEASRLLVEADYDPAAGEAAVRGLPELRGFPARPQALVSASFGGRNEVTLTWSRRGDMPLALRGEVRSFDAAAGVLRADFFVSEPAVLGPRDFEAYAADPRLGRSYFRCRISCDRPAPGGDKPRTLMLTLGRRPGQGEGPLEGWAGRPLYVTQMVYRAPDRQSVLLSRDVPAEVFAGLPERERSLAVVLPLGGAGGGGEYLVLRFDVGPPGTWQEAGGGLGTPGLLLGLLLAGDVRGAAYACREGRAEEVTAFTASLEGVCHERLERPRTDVAWPAERPPERETQGWPAHETYVECGPGNAGDGPGVRRWWPAAAAGVLAAGAALGALLGLRARSRAARAP
jgi:hypothetical protein